MGNAALLLYRYKGGLKIRQEVLTEKAQLVASGYYWDGSKWGNTYLYKIAGGTFFVHHTTRWRQGKWSSTESVTEQRARDWFESLPEHEMSYEEAFSNASKEA